ncbi:creatininase family protein [Curvibacter sp. APW13]|uniref:creatininase family protein n=1 Tax=Curvibacter sp. APW13 TaxID=3077236 RepID=UPI0028E08F81|nr:creatininase family protein [Curvibacter sp. APW13]MDT8993066.1 creatininase family protein [Curvibacter sp. APW13]
MTFSSIERTHRWADCSTADFDRWRADGTVADTVAVLPLGATEQHGPHLPLNVDTTLVDGVVAASLAHLDTTQRTLFLPTQAVGFSPEHAAFGGTLTLKAETVIRLWTELGECVAASGVKKLVLFNAHGGQVGLMDVVGRDLRQRFGMLVYSVNWYGLPLLDARGDDVNALFDAHEHRFGIHAGDIETSMMLALCPQQVDMAQAQNFASTSEDRSRQFPVLGNGRSAKLSWAMQDYNAAGAVGNASVATAAKGVALVEAAGRALATMLGEVHRLPLSTLQNWL